MIATFWLGRYHRAWCARCDSGVLQHQRLAARHNQHGMGRSANCQSSSAQITRTLTRDPIQSTRSRGELTRKASIGRTSKRDAADHRLRVISGAYIHAIERRHSVSSVSRPVEHTHMANSKHQDQIVRRATLDRGSWLDPIAMRSSTSHRSCRKLSPPAALTVARVLLAKSHLQPNRSTNRQQHTATFHCNRSYQ